MMTCFVVRSHYCAKVIRSAPNSKWLQVTLVKSVLLQLSSFLSDFLQGRLRGKIGLFPWNYVAATTEQALPGDMLTQAEVERLEAQLQMQSQQPK